MDHETTTGAASTDVRTGWGRVRFGRRRLPALWAAAPIGALIAAAIGGVMALTGGAGPEPMVGALAVSLITVWPCIGGVWLLLVDRETLRGATANPEQSIESRWYERASSGAFSDVLLIVGIGTAVIAVAGIEVPALLALSAVIVVAMASVAVRYLVERRRG